MNDSLIQVPASLLTSPDLSVTAKLAWMLARLRLVTTEAGMPRPAITTALSRPAMLTGMAQLETSGWNPEPQTELVQTVLVPATLVTDRRLGIPARVLYGLLLLTPGYRHPSGRFTYAQLAAMAHATPKTVVRAVRELVGAEWIKIEQAHRQAPVHFELTFPGFDRQVTALALAQKRVEQASHTGEQLMREYLSLLVDSDHFIDDAAPGFLTNPRTGERLQFDRFYPPDVAWEFNGPQHFGPTQRFSAEVVARQQERDYIKMGICARLKIKLVVVVWDDLTLAAMQDKVRAVLPLRDVSGLGLLVDYLETESEVYRRGAAKLALLFNQEGLGSSS